MIDNSQNIDQTLQSAYQQTEYRLKNTAILIIPGEINPDLDSFLIDNNAWSWIFITADNPQSKLLQPSENQLLNIDLLKYCKNEGFRIWPAAGIPINGSWPTEQSLLILDIGMTKGDEIARLFRQKAYLLGELNQEARFRWMGKEDR